MVGRHPPVVDSRLRQTIRITPTVRPVDWSGRPRASRYATVCANSRNYCRPSRAQRKNPVGGYRPLHIPPSGGTSLPGYPPQRFGLFPGRYFQIRESLFPGFQLRKTKGVSVIESALQQDGEAIITVRGERKYVVLDFKTYNKLREYELDIALQEAPPP